MLMKDAQEAVGRLGAGVIKAMREWASDCEWLDGDELDEMTDAQIVQGIDRHYDGGIAEFLANTTPAESGQVNRELSFLDLVAAMRAGQEVFFRDVVVRGEIGRSCLINGIAREDGSGRKWIVSVAGILRRSDVYWDEAKPCPFIAG